MSESDAHINFDSLATLRKGPSLHNERNHRGTCTKSTRHHSRHLLPRFYRVSSSLNSRGCGIFSDRATLLRDVGNRAAGGIGPFQVVRTERPCR